MLVLGLAASSVAIAGEKVGAQSVPPHPDPSKFQSGDFLWPARPGAFIPFGRTRSLLGTDLGEQEWEAEKRRFIEQARASGDSDQQAAADQLEQLTYEQFRSLYFDDSGADSSRGFSPFAAGLPEVGHVAIIEIDEAGVPWVVEAMPKAQARYESLYSRFKNGVVRTPYEKWIEVDHEDYNVWHGRVANIQPGNGEAIVAVAKAFLGRDYWFWSFNLSDYTGFYCSKLVWVSVWKALGVALDGDTTFLRKFWVTPKALINSNLIELLHNPGTYGR